MGKELVSSPIRVWIKLELESSGGKGDAWRSDSVLGVGITIDDDSSWISIALPWSEESSPGKIVGGCCPCDKSNIFDKLGGGMGIMRELMSWGLESTGDADSAGSFVELAKISRAEGRVVSKRPGAVPLLSSWRRVKNEGSSSSELCAELVGVITL